MKGQHFDDLVKLVRKRIYPMLGDVDERTVTIIAQATLLDSGRAVEPTGEIVERKPVAPYRPLDQQNVSYPGMRRRR